MAAPEPRTDDPVGVSPAALARFDTLCSRMGPIAEAVNAFSSPTLQERAFYELVSIINPGDDVEEDESPELARLAGYLLQEALPGESAVDTAIRVVERFRQGRPTLVSAPAADAVGSGQQGSMFDASRPVELAEVSTVDGGLRREADRIDDREQR